MDNAATICVLRLINRSRCYYVLKTTIVEDIADKCSLKINNCVLERLNEIKYGVKR